MQDKQAISSSDLAHRFLVAMPNLNDPYFYKTVTYICSHDQNGTMGIIINRPLDLKLSQVFSQIGIKNSDKTIHEQAIYSGGPMQTNHGFILHTPSSQQWETTMIINNEMAITTSKDILEGMAAGNKSEHTLVALGYTGWEPGQLEQEIIDNIWLCCPASNEIIFSTPYEQRWQQSIMSMDIDISQLSHDVGYA